MRHGLLVVDDLDINIDIIKLIFEDRYDIYVAKNAAECITAAEEHADHINLVLLDIGLPGMDGIELLMMRKYGDVLSNVPVIIMTARGERDIQIKAFELGAIDFITIPFVKEIAEHRINNAMYLASQLMEFQRQNDAWRTKSEHDLMTGLYNKVTVEELIETAVEQDNYGALFIFDIDNFKKVNDTMGHAVGDKAICQVADFINAQFRRGDLIGRIGGDEFIVYMGNVNDKQVVIDKAEAILANLHDKCNKYITIDIGISFGIAWKDVNDTSFENLFKTADNALYEKKRNGKNGYVILDENC